MSKVLPFTTPNRVRIPHVHFRETTLLEKFAAWLLDYRQRKSLRQIPEELLDDILADEDTRTKELRRRTPTRFNTQIWS